MSILDQYREQAKKDFKLKMKYKGSIDEAKFICKSSAEKEGPSVESDVSRDEFERRYSGLTVVLYLNLIFLAFFCCLLITADSFLFAMITFCSLAISVIVYFKNSFTAWRARYIYERWELRTGPMPVFFSDYTHAIEMNLKELLPLKINYKKGS